MTEPAPRFTNGTAPHSEAMVASLGTTLGLDLAPHRFTLPDGLRVGIDGADADPPTLLVQVTPVIGRVRSTHRNKVIADAFKLTWLRDSHFPDAAAVLALSPELTRFLGPESWLTTSLREQRVTVVMVPSDADPPAHAPTP
ncbi:hypothetical protein [Nocardiopsis sp. MG754419]|uniref:hypothetical protein n=1 Tax=Nocardiopsis sp. MG754419 TaxID=2259865 RepID=UPI001BAB330B|nr:hypothetical protein [Nocardiopsis sp. MG754419]